MNYTQALQKLQTLGQTQLLDYYEELTPSEQKSLLADIEALGDLHELTAFQNRGQSKTLGTLTPIQAFTVEDMQKNNAKFEKVGIEALQNHKVGAVLLAGGSGTRLGFDGPKGTFNIGLTRSLSIFECQMNTIKKVAKKAGVTFPLFVMTSTVNDATTRKYFAEHNYFDYPAEEVFFFVQKNGPVIGEDGKVLLAEKGKVATSPNGNGGWYVSLMESEVGKVVRERGIEWLNIYSVDNVLQQICDPAFIGATLVSGLNSAAKVVKKAYPTEKVGVLCNENGCPAVVEYYEITDELRNLRDADGELTYRWGVILNYLFKVEMLDKTMGKNLPYHLAEKAVAHVENGVVVKPASPNAFKLEALAVDLVKMMGSCLAVEVDREKEFAPVKNKEGLDSVETARAMLVKNGITL
jgi:UDP-N-acetylglucosamine/UDP-N-acetylgalactosamine diphosphorylase